MRRIRTTKVAASRVDPTYVKRPRRVRTWTYVIAGLLSLAAVAWWGLHEVRADKTIVSPGHLTGVHAMWNNNCAMCHLPDPKGHGFLSAVSDQACLQCHDGSVHHPNQKTLVAFAADVPDVHKRSANCTACHIEHRGLEPLLARGDAACVSCHKDLNAVSEKPPLAQPVVMHFAKGDHPPFGRELTPTGTPYPAAGQTTWVDHTPIQFNHKTHSEVSDLQVLDPATNKTRMRCERCHQPSTDVASGEAGRQSQRYMKPINYEQHCAACHALNLTEDPSSPVLPHRDMVSIRRELGNLAGLELDWLNAQPEDVRKSKLETEVAPASPGGPSGAPRNTSPFGRKPAAAAEPEAPAPRNTNPFGRKPAAPSPSEEEGTRSTSPFRRPKTGTPAAPTVKVVITPSEWAAREAARVTKQMMDRYDEKGDQLPGHDRLEAALKARPNPAEKPAEGGEPAATDSGAAKPNDVATLSKMELMVAFLGPPVAKGHGGCSLCHQMTGSPTAVFELAVTPTTQPAGANDAASTRPATTLLATEPTGISHLPRHWFKNSHFSHDAHRSMKCMDCHEQAVKSELTSDVLLPNISSCTTCHKAPTSTDPGAGDSCQLCHVYHDRSLDRIATGGGLSITELSSKGTATTRPVRQ